jgi:hypothetical protein
MLHMLFVYNSVLHSTMNETGNKSICEARVIQVIKYVWKVAHFIGNVVYGRMRWQRL